jgi:hypothetical protein
VAGVAIPAAVVVVVAAVPASPTPWVTARAVDRAQRRAVVVTAVVVVAMVAAAAAVAATAPARPEQPKASLTPCAPVWT